MTDTTTIARGYFSIGVQNISKPMNLGNLIRSAHAFGANSVFTVNPHQRVKENIIKLNGYMRVSRAYFVELFCSIFTLIRPSLVCTLLNVISRVITTDIFNMTKIANMITN